MASILAGDVRIPGTQGKVPKWAALAGLGVVGFLIWRYRTTHSGQPAAPASGTDRFPPDGTVGDPADPYSTDPATGLTYGDEGASGTAGLGGIGGFTGNGTLSGDGTGTQDGTTQGGPPFSTNAQWSQYVLNYFQTNNYGSISGRTDAIGRYLDGLPVNQQQETWINDAIAVGGRPPVSGPGNFPPSIRVSGTKTGGKTYADNPVRGLRVRIIEAGNEPAGRPVPAHAVSAEISWDASPHAAAYRVIVTQGRTTVHAQETSRDSVTVHGLRKGAEYDAKVLARPARPSAHEAETRFRA